MYAPLWLAVASMPPHASQSLMATNVRDEVFDSAGGRNARLVHRLLSPLESLRDVLEDGSPKSKDRSVTPTSESLVNFIGDLALVIGDPSGLKQQALRAFAQTDCFCYQRIAALENVFSLTLDDVTPAMMILPYKYVDRTSQLLDGEGAETVKFSMPLLNRLRQNNPMIEVVPHSARGRNFDHPDVDDDDEGENDVVVDQSMLHCFYVMTTGLTATEFYSFLHCQLMNDAHIGYASSRRQLMLEGGIEGFRQFCVARNSTQKQAAAVAIVRQGFSPHNVILLQSLLRHDVDLFAFLNQTTRQQQQQQRPQRQEAATPIDPMLAFLVVSVFETFPVLSLEKEAIVAAVAASVQRSYPLQQQPPPIDVWCQAALSVGCRIWDIDTAAATKINQNRMSMARGDPRSGPTTAGGHAADSSSQFLAATSVSPVKLQHKTPLRSEQKYGNDDFPEAQQHVREEPNDSYAPSFVLQEAPPPPVAPISTQDAARRELREQIAELRRQKEDLEMESLRSHAPILTTGSITDEAPLLPGDEPARPESVTSTNAPTPPVPPPLQKQGMFLYKLKTSSSGNNSTILDSSLPVAGVNTSIHSASGGGGGGHHPPGTPVHRSFSTGRLRSHKDDSNASQLIPAAPAAATVVTSSEVATPVNESLVSSSNVTVARIRPGTSGEVLSARRRPIDEFSAVGTPRIAEPLAEEVVQKPAITRASDAATPFHTRPWDPQPSRASPQKYAAQQQHMMPYPLPSPPAAPMASSPTRGDQQQVVDTSFTTLSAPIRQTEPSQDDFMREMEAAEADLLQEIATRRRGP